MVASLIDGVILWLVDFVALAGVAAVGVVSPMDDETSVMRAIFLWMALGLVYEVCFTATAGPNARETGRRYSGCRTGRTAAGLDAGS